MLKLIHQKYCFSLKQDPQILWVILIHSDPTHPTTSHRLPTDSDDCQPWLSALAIAKHVLPALFPPTSPPFTRALPPPRFQTPEFIPSYLDLPLLAKQPRNFTLDLTLEVQLGYVAGQDGLWNFISFKSVMQSSTSSKCLRGSSRAQRDRNPYPQLGRKQPRKLIKSQDIAKQDNWVMREKKAIIFGGVSINVILLSYIRSFAHGPSIRLCATNNLLRM